MQVDWARPIAGVAVLGQMENIQGVCHSVCLSPSWGKKKGNPHAVVLLRDKAVGARRAQKEINGSTQAFERPKEGLLPFHPMTVISV